MQQLFVANALVILDPQAAAQRARFHAQPFCDALRLEAGKRLPRVCLKANGQDHRLRFSSAFA